MESPHRILDDTVQKTLRDWDYWEESKDNQSKIMMVNWELCLNLAFLKDCLKNPNDFIGFFKIWYVEYWQVWRWCCENNFGSDAGFVDGGKCGDSNHIGR